MKRLTRLGIMLVTLAISLILINVMRTGNTASVNSEIQVNPDKQRYYLIYLPPRDLTMQINSPSDLTITVYDPLNTVIFTVQNITSGSHALSLEKRGTYNFSFYSAAGETISVEMILTLYNPDKDVTQGSIIMAIIGVAFMLVQSIRTRSIKLRN